MSEMEAAISIVRPEKAPGQDLVFGYYLKHLGPIAKSRLLDLINETCLTGKIPLSWQHVIVATLLKNRLSC